MVSQKLSRNVLSASFSIKWREKRERTVPYGVWTDLDITYVGFSSPFGSSLPNPAGDFSASSSVNKINSASTLPYNRKIDYRTV